MNLCLCRAMNYVLINAFAHLCNAQVRQYCIEVDNGTVPPALVKYLQKSDTEGANAKSDNDTEDDEDGDETTPVKRESRRD